MEDKLRPQGMFSVCTALDHGYHYAFAQLDQMVGNKAQAIWAASHGPSPGIRIVNWEDKIFPAISPGTRDSDFVQTIARVVVYEIL